MRPLRFRRSRHEPHVTRGLRADDVPFVVAWRPKLRCFDAILMVHPGPMNVVMAAARKLRTGCLLDAWAFVLTEQPFNAGSTRVEPGPPTDAVPHENPITAGNALAE